ncbi:MAG: hypothetical protein HY665_04165 [Chloroflexi bacterium]|nr:hypothetical protein [Chloroflexota bacterium]
MARRLNHRDRREMLEMSQQGNSNTKVKDKFKIKDNRTLERHLKLAEQEQEARAARVEVIKEAVSNHFTDIGRLIENWQSALVTLPMHDVYPGTRSPLADIETSPIFQALRQHLPSPDLWRSQSTFSKEMAVYLEACKALRVKIRNSWIIKEALPAGPAFEETILKAKSALKFQLLVTEGHALTDPKYQVLVANGVEVVRGIGIVPPSQFQKLENDECIHHALPLEYLRIGQETMASETYNSAEDQLQRLQNLQAKIYSRLQEAVLRHEHIMYTCDLCPGQPVSARRRRSRNLAVEDLPQPS